MIFVSSPIGGSNIAPYLEAGEMDVGRVLIGLLDPLQPAPYETFAQGSLDLPFEHPEVFMKVKACKRVQLPLPTPISDPQRFHMHTLVSTWLLAIH